MDNNKCKLCNYIFANKYSLERHQKNKKKCIKKTEFKCNICNRCFQYNKSLKEHIENNVCKKIFENNNEYINDKLNKNILELLESKINNKCFLLKQFGVKMNDDAINEILESNISIDFKISCFINNINSKSSSNITNSNNTNSNNTTNNILINNFGNEKTDYLTNEYFSKLLQNNYGKDSFLKLSNEIYLNKEKPENNTIKIDNLNNKYCKVIENNKWITTTKDNALKKIFNNVSDIILLILDDVKDKVPEKRREIIANYLEKDIDDEYIKETLTEMILKIYNFTLNDLNNL
jgi:hypothetical protein